MARVFVLFAAWIVYLIPQSSAGDDSDGLGGKPCTPAAITMLVGGATGAQTRPEQPIRVPRAPRATRTTPLDGTRTDQPTPPAESPSAAITPAPSILFAADLPSDVEFIAVPAQAQFVVLGEHPPFSAAAAADEHFAGLMETIGWVDALLAPRNDPTLIAVLVPMPATPEPFAMGNLRLVRSAIQPHSARDAYVIGSGLRDFPGNIRSTSLYPNWPRDFVHAENPQFPYFVILARKVRLEGRSDFGLAELAEGARLGIDHLVGSRAFASGSFHHLYPDPVNPNRAYRMFHQFWDDSLTRRQAELLVYDKWTDLLYYGLLKTFLGSAQLDGQPLFAIDQRFSRDTADRRNRLGSYLEAHGLEHISRWNAERVVTAEDLQYALDRVVAPAGSERLGLADQFWQLRARRTTESRRGLHDWRQEGLLLAEATLQKAKILLPGAPRREHWISLDEIQRKLDALAQVFRDADPILAMIEPAWRLRPRTNRTAQFLRSGIDPRAYPRVGDRFDWHNNLPIGLDSGHGRQVVYDSGSDDGSERAIFRAGDG